MTVAASMGGVSAFGDQPAQERNQHDERDTNCEATGAKLREELRIPGIRGDRRGAGRLGDHA